MNKAVLSSPALTFLEDRWDPAVADRLDEPELLRYRSNLLGSDLRITNFAGGNTSSKIDELDPLTGETVKVLWVKRSCWPWRRSTGGRTRKTQWWRCMRCAPFATIPW